VTSADSIIIQPDYELVELIT